ncbi:MAG: MFS transporter [Limisphaerales bacterium]
MSRQPIWQPYHTIWTALFLGWVVSYIDRALTGPVITWMIANKVSFMGDVAHPHAFGGLIGSLFFAGYMLTQFPGGYFGDKYGHRAVVLVSIFWAALTTLLTGLIGGLLWFVGLRVLTGLGEGAFYSNDRTIIARTTPPEKIGLGMGVVISGLTLGLTIALLATPPVIAWAQPLLGQDAWRAPFLLMSVPTLLVGLYMVRALRSVKRPDEKTGAALRGLTGYSAFFFFLIMAVYIGATRLGFSPGTTGLILSAFAIVFVVYLYCAKRDSVGPVLLDRNLLLIYLSAVPILWHLWLYSFWAVDIIKDSGSSFMAAALTASFNAIAGLIGFPLGGWLSDRAVRNGGSRRNVLAWLTAIEAVSILAFAALVTFDIRDPVVVSALLFVSGLFFFAQQSVSHALTAELAPASHRGKAFGLWNLIAEIGALLSPVISGTLRDHTGGWGAALLLDGALMTLSCVLILAIRPRPAG